MATHEVSVRRLIFANLLLQHSYHDEHRVDATLANGWSTISQCLYWPLEMRLPYTTNSVMAPSRRWTCMSAAAGSSQPSSLERAIVLGCVMSIGIVTITNGQQSLLLGGALASGTFALPGSFTSELLMAMVVAVAIHYYTEPSAITSTTCRK